MRRLMFSLICSSGKAANLPKPTSVGITSSQFRIAFGVTWSVASAGSVRGRYRHRTFDLDERPVGSKSPSMGERQAKVVCLLPECSRCALHGSCNLLNWRLASRVCPQLLDILL